MLTRLPTSMICRDHFSTLGHSESNCYHFYSRVLLLSFQSILLDRVSLLLRGELPFLYGWVLRRLHKRVIQIDISSSSTRQHRHEHSHSQSHFYSTLFARHKPLLNGGLMSTKLFFFFLIAQSLYSAKTRPSLSILHRRNGK